MAAKRVGINDRLEQEVKPRPIDALIRPKEDIKEDDRRAEEKIAATYMAYKKAVRKTFVLDPIAIEAIRIFTFRHKRRLSEALMDMLLKCIPADIWTEARNDVIDIEETPADYLEDLEKLDIDSIYYHKRKK